MRKALTASLTAASILVAGGFYGLADALDIVPGVLTVAPETLPVQPFPTLAAGSGAQPSVNGLAADAPVPGAAVLEALAQALDDDALTGEATTSVSVIDVATGKQLVDHGAAVPLSPASSNKVLTAWAALSLLGAEHTLSTSTVLEGSTLTLVGGGDVLLAADAGDPGSTAGHAGLGDLARASAETLKTRGVTSVSVALDDTLFSGPTWNNGWESGNEAWVAPVQPIMVDVTTHPEGGGYPSDPALEAAQTFTDRLKDAGITVNGEVTRAAASQGATEIAVVESSPLGDVLAVSLKASDNTMTEVEGRLVAVAAGQEASFTGAVTAVRDQIVADGFSVEGLTLVDCSGLATGDRVPAQLLAQVVARAASQDGGTVGRTLIADLPVAALDGTLDDRFVGVTGAGTVRAKTGSLEQVASLTGTVVTRDGRLLAFAVILNGFQDGGLASARTALDQDLVGPLADCGCQG